MDEEGALFDSGFDGGEPFRVTPEPGGISLESALRDFGPAAIDDLIPRLFAIARILDGAHAQGVIHGALHPSKVIVTDDATSLLAGDRSTLPYIAPELMDGEPAAPASDQFALAAIAYEWLFGRPISGPAERHLEVRSMPGVDRHTLSDAFTRALAPRSAARFASCTEFCSAVAASVESELPLLAATAAVDDVVDDDPLDRLSPAPFDSKREDAFLAQGEPNVDDLTIVAEEPVPAAADHAFTMPPEPERAVASWNPSASAATPTRDGFGGFALILAAIVGAVFGFAAGYMARPRALQSSPPQEIAFAPGTDAPIAARASEPGEPRESSDAGARDAKGTTGKRPASPASPVSPASPAKVGRLLVRSIPSGASVSVEGVVKGVTPLALTDLATGSVNITVARRGYLPETRKIVITAARPSRSLDVRLAAEAAAPARPSAVAKGRSGEPATPSTIGKPAAATTGALAVESRPVGASITLNGQPRGKTPSLITGLAPGEYRIQLAMPGYRNFTTTVRVVAGERVRAAASLTAQEQE